jgi:hypothetical protein
MREVCRLPTFVANYLQSGGFAEKGRAGPCMR